jgi:copper chaperone
MKKIYKVNDMHCSSCALLIEGELEDIGVSASCSYAKGQVEVEYDAEKISESDITEAVKKAGYSLDAS